MNAIAPLATKISVIMLSYNHGVYLEEAVRSVWTQNYPNLELVVADDLSSDNSRELLVQLKARSPIPMTVLLNSRNLGINPNLNQAIAHATGDYIAFCSSDDRLAPSRFEMQAEMLEAEPDLKIVYANGVMFSGSDIFDRIHGPAVVDLLRKPPAEIVDYLYSHVSPLYIQTVLIRRDFLEACRGYDERILADDWVLNIRIFEQLLAAVGKHAYADMDVCQYRLHATNQARNWRRHIRLMKQVVQAYTPRRLKRQAWSNIYWEISENQRINGRPFSRTLYFIRSTLNRKVSERTQAFVDSTATVQALLHARHLASIAIFGPGAVRRLRHAVNVRFGYMTRSMGPGTNGLPAIDPSPDAASQLGPLFDAGFYLAAYSDVAVTGIDPAAHYLIHGLAERRNPNAFFDTALYLERHPDVAASGMNPLLHYIHFGASEGRDPHPAFSTRYYVLNNLVVDAGGINPLLHYLAFGAKAGRFPNLAARQSAAFRRLTPEQRRNGDQVRQALQRTPTENE